MKKYGRVILFQISKIFSITVFSFIVGVQVGQMYGSAPDRGPSSDEVIGSPSCGPTCLSLVLLKHLNDAQVAVRNGQGNASVAMASINSLKLLHDSLLHHFEPLNDKNVCLESKTQLARDLWFILSLDESNLLFDHSRSGIRDEIILKAKMARILKLAADEISDEIHIQVARESYAKDNSKIYDKKFFVEIMGPTMLEHLKTYNIPLRIL